MMALHLFLVSYALLWNQVLSAGPLVTIVHDLVQWNIAGTPVIHQKSNWDFNPNAGKQRQIRYEMVNGRFGNDAIARLGLGVSAENLR